MKKGRSVSNKKKASRKLSKPCAAKMPKRHDGQRFHFVVPKGTVKLKRHSNKVVGKSKPHEVAIPPQRFEQGQEQGKNISEELRSFTPTWDRTTDKAKAFVLWFDQLAIEDVPLVGGKNASLGEMYCQLTPKGIRIPNGFAISAFGYRYFIEAAGIREEIQRILDSLHVADINDLNEKGQAIRNLIRNSEIPPELASSIKDAYYNLCVQYGRDTDVAVRSSATAEDLPDASFAGQQETFLNIRGYNDLIDACKRCFASLFTNRAISYRADKKYDHFAINLSIGVQKMVRSDKACSGVMFTIDTESGFRDVILINSSYGLGENIVQGAVNPDEFLVFKPTLKQGYKPIISKKLGSKAQKLIYSQDGSKPTKNIEVPKPDRDRFTLDDGEVLALAAWGCVIEDHYTAKAGHFKPMDIEWAKDGTTGQLFIVQARPETVMSLKDPNMFEEYVLSQRGRVIVEGSSVGQKIGAGKAHVIRDVHNIREFKPGEVLVTEMTDPDWEPIMKIAAAIVTERGGRSCHAAIVSRELGIPCIVGTKTATTLIKPKHDVTVSCAEGEVGKVYEGILKYELKKTNLKEIPKTRTKIMMNVGEPEQAFEHSFIPNQGVGLAREEFIINSYIKIHPMALINFDTLEDKEAKELIIELTAGYSDKTQYFVDKLAEGIATISAAFYPKDVILRFSDFKTNEYANLIGGKKFEPKEDNPMIGWRGASRYYDDKYRAGFALECRAILKARNEMGLTNLKVMIPFCRTVDEGRKVIAEMKKNALVQGENGLEVYVMCEIPSNVVLADQFCEIFDGFSIGSNDLTQLTLGLDRDSELVARIFDERNDAVKRLVATVIKIANASGKKIGICGQAPSDFPEFAEFLVECGINSISLNPDTVIKTTIKIAQKEKELNIQ